MFYDDPSQHNLRHSPFKALVSPRPIAWVSTIDINGVANIAPYSFFNAVSERPPMVIFAPNGPRPSGGAKDTLVNIEQTNEFVINLCGWELREQMNISSAHVASEIDEFELTGLTPADCMHINAPRIAEAPASLECRFHSRIRLPSTNPKAENNVVIGEVVGIHIADEIIVDGMIDMAKYQPIARLGYMDYTRVEHTFEMLRPDDDIARPTVAS